MSGRPRNAKWCIDVFEADPGDALVESIELPGLQLEDIKRIVGDHWADDAFADLIPLATEQAVELASLVGRKVRVVRVEHFLGPIGENWS